MARIIGWNGEKEKGRRLYGERTLSPWLRFSHLKDLTTIMKEVRVCRVEWGGNAGGRLHSIGVSLQYSFIYVSSFSQ